MIDPLTQKRSAYREVFGSFQGRAVLADILVDLDFFQPKPDALRIEIAHGILNRIGILHDANVDRIVDALLSVANDEDKRVVTSIQGGQS